jgi:hypothetical protein
MGVTVELAALCVATDVQGKDHLGCKFATLLEHGIDGVGIGVGMGGQGAQGGRDIEQFVQNKLHVAQGGSVDRHVDRYRLRWEKKVQAGRGSPLVQDCG